mmetsp:Transcript_56274/g.134967  ORF Transcript_56274/g.134967 Transcript_56274/m.134967 type:complete len:204 (+) Transcript_56274:3567-4178(+)
MPRQKTWCHSRPSALHSPKAAPRCAWSTPGSGSEEAAKPPVPAFSTPSRPSLPMRAMARKRQRPTPSVLAGGGVCRCALRCLAAISAQRSCVCSSAVRASCSECVYTKPAGAPCSLTTRAIAASSVFSARSATSTRAAAAGRGAKSGLPALNESTTTRQPFRASSCVASCGVNGVPSSTRSSGRLGANASAMAAGGAIASVDA